MATIKGNTWSETINGTNGNDTIDGAGGNDFIDGGAGNDTAVFFANSSDFTVTDLSGAVRVTGLSSAPSPYRNTTVKLLNVENVQFADATVPLAIPDNNIILKNTYSETINGTDGNDTIDGAGGNDFIDGGAGNDTAVFFANSSDFTITDLSGAVRVTGHDSAPSPYRNTTVKLLNVENVQFADATVPLAIPDNNIILKNTYSETINGTDGNDTIDGAGGNDFIDGGAGNDTAVFFANSSDFTITDLSGAVRVTGHDSAPSPYWNTTVKLLNIENVQFADTTISLTIPSNNIILKNTYSETINGTDGNDTIDGAGGNDFIDGGAGNDTAVFFANSSDFIVTATPDGMQVEGLSSAPSPYRNTTVQLHNVEHIQFADSAIGTWQISPQAVSASETSGSIQFLITRPDYRLGLQETVYISTVQLLGGAPNDNDYVGLLNQPYTFLEGEKVSDPIIVNILTDNINEPDETFGFIVQSNPTDPTSTFHASAKFTIVDAPSINLPPIAQPASPVKNLESGQSIALNELFIWDDPNGITDVVSFAVRDRSIGGGYLTENGIKFEDGQLHDNVPISEISNWAFVAGNEGSVDEVAFNAIDVAGAFSTPSAVSTITATASDSVNPPYPNPLKGPLLLEVVNLANFAYDENTERAEKHNWQPYSGLGFQAVNSISIPIAGSVSIDNKLHIYEANIEGQRTLALAFEGTDKWLELILQSGFWRQLYDKHSAVIKNAIDYASSAEERGERKFDQMIVTGHSLGGILTEEFFAADLNHTPLSKGAYGITFGSPGSPRPAISDGKLLNFASIGDPIAALHSDSFFGMTVESPEPDTWTKALVEQLVLATEIAKNPEEAVLGIMNMLLTEGNTLPSREGKNVNIINSTDGFIGLNILARHQLESEIGYISNIERMLSVYGSYSRPGFSDLDNFWLKSEKDLFYTVDPKILDLVIGFSQRIGFGAFELLTTNIPKVVIGVTDSFSPIVSDIAVSLREVLNNSVSGIIYIGDTINNKIAKPGGEILSSFILDLRDGVSSGILELRDGATIISQEAYEASLAAGEYSREIIVKGLEQGESIIKGGLQKVKLGLGEGSIIVLIDEDNDGQFDTKLLIEGDYDLDLVQVRINDLGLQISYGDPLPLSDREIIGTTVDETLVGTEEADIIRGVAGDNMLLGGGGDDVLFGGFGNDILNGDEGDDRLIVFTGKNTLLGGHGDDVLESRSNLHNFLDGGEGNDVLLGLNGPTTYLFSPNWGNDFILEYDNNLTGKAHIDIIHFAAGISPGDLTYTTINDRHLLISHINGQDSITIIDQFGPSSATQVERIEFADLPNNYFDITHSDGVATISSSGPNNVPVALDDTFNGTFGIEPASGNLLVNDSDPDDDTLSIVSYLYEGDGVLSIAVDGYFSYAPAAGFVGVDSFTYTIADSFGATASADVDLTVLPIIVPTTIRIGDAPARVTSVSQLVDAWSDSLLGSITHKSDTTNPTETWSSVTLGTSGTHLLTGGDLYAGDLGVSGRSVTTSTIAQELDGTEGLRFEFTEAATVITVNLNRFYSNDAGSGYNESGRMRLFDTDGHLVGETTFVADALNGQKTISLASDTPFTAVEFNAGAYIGDQFIFGALAASDGVFGSAIYTDAAGKLNGSDFLIDWIEPTFVISLVGQTPDLIA